MHILFFRVRSDDILITSKRDTEHLSNLNKILNVIQTNGYGLKLHKFVFMADEVIRLNSK